MLEPQILLCFHFEVETQRKMKFEQQNTAR